jgi:hypothetical protein
VELLGGEWKEKLDSLLCYSLLALIRIYPAYAIVELAVERMGAMRKMTDQL